MICLVESYGPNILGVNYKVIAKYFTKSCNSQIKTLRKTAAYGIGAMVANGGNAFNDLQNDFILGLKSAICIQMPEKVKGR